MLVGFSGPKCAGKNAAADFLQGKYDGDFVAFADKLKVVAADLFGIDTKRKNEWDTYVLQRLGTEAVRAIDPNTWVYHAVKQIAWAALDNEWVYVTDVRYQNEVDAIHAVGGVVIKCHCDENIRKGRIMSLYGFDAGQNITGHSSETGALVVDATINTTTRSDMESELESYIIRMRTRAADRDIATRAKAWLKEANHTRRNRDKAPATEEDDARADAPISIQTSRALVSLANERGWQLKLGFDAKHDDEHSTMDIQRLIALYNVIPERGSWKNPTEYAAQAMNNMRRIGALAVAHMESINRQFGITYDQPRQ